MVRFCLQVPIVATLNLYQQDFPVVMQSSSLVKVAGVQYISVPIFTVSTLFRCGQNPLQLWLLSDTLSSKCNSVTVLQPCLWISLCANDWLSIAVYPLLQHCYRTTGPMEHQSVKPECFLCNTLLHLQINVRYYVWRPAVLGSSSDSVRGWSGEIMRE